VIAAYSAAMDNETENLTAFEPLYSAGWKVRNRKLRHPLKDSTDWLEFEADFEMRPTLGGLGNVDTFSVADWPDGGSFEGMTVRIYDTREKVWRIYWASVNRTGLLEAPVVGRFTDGHGEFFCDDEHEGTPIQVRYTWSDITATSAHWTQAFSADGGDLGNQLVHGQ
jgi:hypothetical protein